MTRNTQSPRIFMVAGEHSGDALGAPLVAALRERLGPGLTVSGVGGAAMQGQGCDSLFPLSDVAVMGPLEIFLQLPRLMRRVYQTVDAGVKADPDVVVILDSPEFTHPIARRIRKRRPDIPIVDYVSPSVWAWRPGRARKMRAYVDHVLAILPFEPAAHARLGGPPCSYVGHPLTRRMDWLAGLAPDALAGRLGLDPDRPVLVVLPGSRSSEVKRLMGRFGDAIARTIAGTGPCEVIVPVVPWVRELVEAGLAAWPVKPHLIEDEAEKFQAFRLARAALAASGTATLELALAGCPMVVGYRVDAAAAQLQWLVNVPSFVLPNLILEHNVFPEFMQQRCTGEALSGALVPLMRAGETPERAAQLSGLEKLSGRMRFDDGSDPSHRAADIVIATMQGHGHRV